MDIVIGKTLVNFHISMLNPCLTNWPILKVYGADILQLSYFPRVTPKLNEILIAEEER